MGGSGGTRHGVPLTNLDQPLFGGADATKRDLVEYLDAVGDQLVDQLRDRPLSVVRVLRGKAPFMQKNLSGYAPDWIPRVSIWAHASGRDVAYPLCNDRRTLVWLANQRAVEYHPPLVTVDAPDRPSHLVLDLDPPPGAAFPVVVRVARTVRRALGEAGLDGAVKTSGSKGLHVFVPLAGHASGDDVAAATRAIAARAERLDPTLATTAFIRADRSGKVFIDATRTGTATVVAAYSPRVRPGTPVSYPLSWDSLDHVTPTDFTVRTAARLVGDRDPWTELMPTPAELPTDLITEGRAIPVARVQAMHEGKRRARARQAASAEPPTDQPARAAAPGRAADQA